MKVSAHRMASPLHLSNPQTLASLPRPRLLLCNPSPRRLAAIATRSPARKLRVFSPSPVAVATTDAIKTREDPSAAPAEEERVVLPTNESSAELLRIRHTCAHVMAMAVQKLFPGSKVTIGPWIDNGFFYDFDMEPLMDKDLKRIKKEMDRIISQNLPLVREEVSRDEAKERILAMNEPYKLEILESIKDDSITIYHIGTEWWDLCAGPHVDSTGHK